MKTKFALTFVTIVGLTSFVSDRKAEAFPTATVTDNGRGVAPYEPATTTLTPRARFSPPPSIPAHRPTPAPRPRGLDVGTGESSGTPDYPNQSELSRDELAQMLFNNKMTVSPDGKELVIEYDAYFDGSSAEYQCGNMISFVGPEYRSDANLRGVLAIRAKDDGFRACRENFKDDAGKYIGCERWVENPTTQKSERKNFCRHFIRTISLVDVDVPANLEKVDLALAWRKGNSDDQSAIVVRGLQTAQMIDRSKYRHLIAQMDNKKGFDPSAMEATIEKARALNLIDQTKVASLKKFVETYKHDEELKQVDEQIAALKADGTTSDGNISSVMEDLAKIGKKHPDRKKAVAEAQKDIAEHYLELASDEASSGERGAARRAARYLSAATEGLKHAGAASPELLEKKMEIQRESIALFLRTGDVFSADKAQRSLMAEANKLYAQAYRIQVRACATGSRTFSLETCADANERVQMIQELAYGKAPGNPQNQPLSPPGGPLSGPLGGPLGGPFGGGQPGQFSGGPLNPYMNNPMARGTPPFGMANSNFMGPSPTLGGFNGSFAFQPQPLGNGAFPNPMGQQGFWGGNPNRF